MQDETPPPGSPRPGSQPPPGSPPPGSPPPGSEPPPAAQGPRDPNARNWAVACHLAAFVAPLLPGFGQIVGPLAVWLLKRHDDPFIDEHGKESVNFQISITIYAAVASLLIFVLVGVLLLPLVVLFAIIMVIIAAIKASDGKPFRYPLTIRLIN